MTLYKWYGNLNNLKFSISILMNSKNLNWKCIGQKNNEVEHAL